ncbi:hypothetical protein BB558_005762, partial [Smittium angustum]
MTDSSQIHNNSIVETIEWIPVNGTEHYTRLYNSPSDIKATLVIIHGFGEHSDRYEGMARRFVQNNIRVFAFDSKGFGRTGIKAGKLGNIGNFKSVYSTIYKMINLLKEKFPNEP